MIVRLKEIGLPFENLRTRELSNRSAEIKTLYKSCFRLPDLRHSPRLFQRNNRRRACYPPGRLVESFDSKDALNNRNQLDNLQAGSEDPEPFLSLSGIFVQVGETRRGLCRSLAFGGIVTSPMSIDRDGIGLCARIANLQNVYDNAHSRSSFR